MKLGDMARLMRPWNRLRISGFNQVDIHGNRIWTQTLTDAQIYAYWSREVLNSIVDEKTSTVFCILDDR